MKEYNLHIEGMRCGMCEEHINNVIRNNFKVKKLKSNRHKNLTTFLSEEDIDESMLKSKISALGYEIKDI